MLKQNVISETKAEHVLHEYQPGDFFIASPHRVLLAKGVREIVPKAEGQNQIETLSRRITETLRQAKQSGQSRPLVVGAVPFDHVKEARLIVPEEVRSSGPLQFDYAENEQQPENTYHIEPVPAPEEYKNGVEQGLARIGNGTLSKIVMSRSLHLTSSEPIQTDELLRHLARHNSHGYTFAADLSSQAEPSSRRTLLGASPELLVSRMGTHVVSNPLAGSRPRSDDPVEDQGRAAELLSSAKDLHEHAVVADAVAAALRPFCRTLDVPDKPSLIQTETMWHLSSVIKGELSDPSVTALELAAALHPTPAVCGTPTDLAREAILSIEPFDRGFFTGMLGWCDDAGDGEWIVTIRCAEAEERSLRLYAGAGVVAGSKPEDELQETSAKFRTMLRAMGVNHI
ncbi:isochorismate synthase DhbC [Bacillus vallismortis]|uniref:isochorismate synthase DhbC n=1 Tax=Bacillus vallismortis TaxID=72361 RepID=UPI002281346D|nr:isochorismate synthase DhbC [Bacillus vallismortis]MCY7919187.1 isochorismate synthase DhbC [Bacillus vallismortis]